MLPPARPNSQRRAILTATLGRAAVLTPFPLLAKARRVRFDRAAYDRCVGLMNVGDPRMADYYADDIRFIMGIRGKAEALRFMHRQSPFVKESLEVQFFC